MPHGYTRVRTFFQHAYIMRVFSCACSRSLILTPGATRAASCESRTQAIAILHSSHASLHRVRVACFVARRHTRLTAVAEWKNISLGRVGSESTFAQLVLHRAGEVWDLCNGPPSGVSCGSRPQAPAHTGTIYFVTIWGYSSIEVL